MSGSRRTSHHRLRLLMDRIRSVSNAPHTILSRLSLQCLRILNVTTHLTWLDAEQELAAVREILPAADFEVSLEKAGAEVLSSQLEIIYASLPRSVSVTHLLDRLPFIFALFFSGVSVTTLPAPGKADIRILYPDAWPPEDREFQYGMLSSLLRIFGKSAVIEASEQGFQISYREDQLAPALDGFSRSVFERANGLLQDKRELQTAVEYLNAANDQLERELRANRREMQMAENIQRGFIPQAIPDWNGIRFSVRYRPLHAVSGDFFDFHQQGQDRMRLLVADVSGHGVPAALIAIAAKLSFLSHRNNSPSEIFSKVNLDMLRFVKQEGYLTAGYFEIRRNREVTYSLGAIPPPVWYRSSVARSVVLSGGGTVLGMFPNANELFNNETIRLDPGDRLFIFTDGLTEAPDRQDNAFGYERLTDSIAEAAGMSLDAAADYVIEKYRQHILGNDPKDDLTLVVLEASTEWDKFIYFSQLAGSAIKDHRIDEAILHLRSARSLFPKHLATIYKLARLLAMIAEYKEALSLLREFSQMRPYNARVHTLEAVCHYRQGRFSLALESLLRARSLNEDDQDLLASIIRLELKLKMKTEAVIHSQRLRELNPGHPLMEKVRHLLD